MTNVPVFCKVPIPDCVKNVLDTMEKDPCANLLYINMDGTVDEYKTHVESIENYEGFFAVYEGYVSEDGRDCITWYIDGQDGSVVSDVDTAWYVFRDFVLGYSGIEDLQEYVDEKGIFVRPGAIH